MCEEQAAYTCTTSTSYLSQKSESHVEQAPAGCRSFRCRFVSLRQARGTEWARSQILSGRTSCVACDAGQPHESSLSTKDLTWLTPYAHLSLTNNGMRTSFGSTSSAKTPHVDAHKDRPSVGPNVTDVHLHQVLVDAEVVRGLVVRKHVL